MTLERLFSFIFYLINRIAQYLFIMEAPKKSNTKLTNMLTIEQEMQAKWEKEKAFERNPSDENPYLYN